MNWLERIRPGESKTLDMKLRLGQNKQFAKAGAQCARVNRSRITRIKILCNDQYLTEPSIHEKGDFVDVVFYRPVLDIGVEVPDTGAEMPDTVPPQMHVVLAHIQQRGHITAPEVAKLLAVKDRRARSVLKEMLDQGLRVKQGNARQTVYVRVGHE